MIVAAWLLFGALSHYPIHRLDRLKPLLAHNQHPADGVAVERSSNTASAERESCGCFSPALYWWQIVRDLVCVCMCVFTVTLKKFCLTPPRPRQKAPCRRCTSVWEHPSGTAVDRCLPFLNSPSALVLDRCVKSLGSNCLQTNQTCWIPSQKNFFPQSLGLLAPHVY